MKNKKKIMLCVISLISFIFIASICANIFKSNNEEGIVYGRKNAPIVIEEYSSFECGDCKELHDSIGKELTNYIKLGKVRYVFKPVDIKRFKYDDFIYQYLNYKQLRDINELQEIFEKQEEWKKLKSEAEIGKKLNLSKNKNIMCKKDTLWVKEELAELEITQVPAMYINGEKVDGKITKEEFIKKIEQILE